MTRTKHERCDGRGLCAELRPDVFTRHDWRLSVGVQELSLAKAIPSTSLKYAKEAVRRCPRIALRLLG
jgi:ferredoxin